MKADGLEFLLLFVLARTQGEPQKKISGLTSFTTVPSDQS